MALPPRPVLEGYACWLVAVVCNEQVVASISVEISDGKVAGPIDWNVRVERAEFRALGESAGTIVFEHGQFTPIGINNVKIPVSSEV